jgi:hypothetical protein
MQMLRRWKRLCRTSISDTTFGNGKPKPSIASLSTDDILVKASRLGISLENKKEALKVVDSIKEVDVNRTLVMLKKNVEDHIDKEEGQNSLLTLNSRFLLEI